MWHCNVTMQRDDTSATNQYQVTHSDLQTFMTCLNRITKRKQIVFQLIIKKSWSFNNYFSHFLDYLYGDEFPVVISRILLNSCHALVSFYSPWKHRITRGFLMFSRGLKENSGMKWVKMCFCIEAVVRRCSVENVLPKTLQNPQ